MRRYSASIVRKQIRFAYPTNFALTVMPLEAGTTPVLPFEYMTGAGRN